jgi:hypothetical protein
MTNIVNWLTDNSAIIGSLSGLGGLIISIFSIMISIFGSRKANTLSFEANEIARTKVNDDKIAEKNKIVEKTIKIIIDSWDTPPGAVVALINEWKLKSETNLTISDFNYIWEAVCRRKTGKGPYQLAKDILRV